MTAAFSAARVGVELPLATPPFADVRPVIAVAIAGPVIAATGTAALLFTPHEPLSAKNFKPQFTSLWVSLTTWLIAGSSSGLGRDLARASQAIITAVEADEPPTLLILGPDALGVIRSVFDARLAELLAWEQTSRSTNLQH